MAHDPAKIIVGIDPGIADTGYGILKRYDRGDLECVGYGCIKTKAGQEMAYRLEELSRAMGELLKQYRPGLLAVEQLFFCKNVKTALAVGQARGVVLLSARANRVPVAEYTPLQVKQAVSAYGRAGKAQVQKMVKLLLGMDRIPAPDDAADALAVAVCAANNSNINDTAGLS